MSFSFYCRSENYETSSHRPVFVRLVLSHMIIGPIHQALAPTASHLHWPAPTVASQSAVAFMDFPRFFAPAWGPTPIPAGAPIDPALNHTNGYMNNQCFIIRLTI